MSLLPLSYADPLVILAAKDVIPIRVDPIATASETR